MKSRRQSKILELIKKDDIETQEELISKLREENLSVTQATVSRDIRELKLSKAMSDKGKYKYVPASHHNNINMTKFNAALADSITSVDFASNNVVIRTFPGMAQAVATGIDAISGFEILGCVAGDDTIIVVTRDEESAAEVSERIRELIITV